MKVIKRDGHMVDFEPAKIEIAINKANAEVEEEDRASAVQIKNIIRYIEHLDKKRILVEDIQDIIELKLMSIGKYELAKKYIKYRFTRELIRKSNTTDLAIKQLLSSSQNDFDDPTRIIRDVISQRNDLSSITSEDITKRFLLTDEISQADENGLIYFHDKDSFTYNGLVGDCLINLKDMLLNGFYIEDVAFTKPNDLIQGVFYTNQIVDKVMSCQFGNCFFRLNDLDFLVDKTDISYEIALLMQHLSTIRERKCWIVIDPYDEKSALLAESLLNYRLKNADYSVNIIYLVSVTNTDENSPYYAISKLSLKAKTPYYISKETFRSSSFFSQGRITLNLAEIAIESDNNFTQFEQMIVEKLEIVHRGLQIRHKRLTSVVSDSAPILWQSGGLARLGKNETIHLFLHHQYSHIDVGYLGLPEAIKYVYDITSKNQFEELKIHILTLISKTIATWSNDEDISYVLSESREDKICHLFANSSKENHGIIKGINDKESLTLSNPTIKLSDIYQLASSLSLIQPWAYSFVSEQPSEKEFATLLDLILINKSYLSISQ